MTSTLTIVIMHKYEFLTPNFKYVKRSLKAIDRYLVLPVGTSIVLALEALDQKQLQTSRETKGYKKFVLKLSKYGRRGVQVLIPRKWGHLSGNICNAMDFVKSENILVLHSDTPFSQTLNIELMLLGIDFDYIRFNARRNMEAGWDKELEQVTVGNFELCKSSFYGDANHLVKKEFFRSQIEPLIRDKCGFPEQLLLGKDWRNAKFYLYGAIGHRPVVVRYGLWGRILAKQAKRTNHLIPVLIISSCKWILLKLFKKIGPLWKLRGYGDRSIR